MHRRHLLLEWSNKQNKKNARKQSIIPKMINVDARKDPVVIGSANKSATARTGADTVRGQSTTGNQHVPEK